MIHIKAVFGEGDSTPGDEKPESNVHQRLTESEYFQFQLLRDR